jgi:hypothetical protein
MGEGSSCFAPQRRLRLEHRFQTAQGLPLRPDQRQERVEPQQPAKSGAAKEAPATRLRPAVESPPARPVKLPCPERKRHAPMGEGSNYF